MTKIVPYQILFDRAKTFSKTSNFFVWFSACISIIILFVAYSYSSEKIFLKFLTATNCTGIFLVYLFDILFNHFFFLAEKAKRLDFIDNSFGTDFSGKKSQGYFSNDDLTIGIYKMAVNCFENSFFSSQISSKMLTRTWVKMIIVLIIFIFSAALGERQIIITLFQLLLPILLIQQSIKLTQFATRIVGVYQSFLQLFNDIKQTKNIEIKQPEMLKIVLDYQTTLAWGGTLLNSNLFEKNNPKLSEDWEQMKRLYKIEDY